MKIHLYMSDQAPAKKRLQTLVHDNQFTSYVIEYQSLEAVQHELLKKRRFYDEREILIIMAAVNRELIQFAAGNYDWTRFKTILILENSAPETIKIAHKLHPIYITFIESDFSDVSAILQKLQTKDTKWMSKTVEFRT